MIQDQLRKISYLGMILILFQFLDIYSTVAFMSKGIPEGNPLPKLLISVFGFSGLFIGKAVVIILIFCTVQYVMIIHERKATTKKELAFARRIIEAGFKSGIVIYAIIVGMNIFAILLI
jgi:hypothetical protein